MARPSYWLRRVDWSYVSLQTVLIVSRVRPYHLMAACWLRERTMALSSCGMQRVDAKCVPLPDTKWQ
jgi:hypothetical protein